jgi:hypothetical protein
MTLLYVTFVILHVVKTLGGAEAQFHSFLTSPLDEDDHVTAWLL